MKKMLFYAIIIASTVTFVACGDKNKDPEPATSAETTAELDNSSFGLYKGVIVGSSGTIKIEINNGNNVAKATVTIDNQTDELTCTSLLINGQAIVNAAFNGTFSSFTFSVDADGKNPVIINITVEGHDNVSAAIAKETSSNVAYAYEGTSAGGNNHRGVFNIVRNNNSFSGKGKAADGLEFSISGNIKADGTFSTNTTTVYNGLNVSFTVSGKFTGDNVSGTWNNSWNGGTNSGTFSGRKTL